MKHTFGQHTVLLLGLSLALAACNPQSAPKINTPPQAVLKLTPQEGDGPLVVSADGSSSTDSDGTISSYSWDWGDGSDKASGVKGSHTFAAKATPYTVTLTVTDNGGATNNATATVTSRSKTVAPPASDKPTADFTVTPNQGSAPLSVAVDASGSSVKSGKIVSYAWDWGDKSAASDGQTSSHVYTAQGAFSITLKVTDDKGQTASATKAIGVGQAAPPADTTSPIVTSSRPNNAAHKIKSDTKITINFSETMEPDSTEKAFKSTSAGLKQGEVDFNWSNDYTVLDITPKNPLAYGNAQNREMQWSLQGAKDKAGNVMPIFSSSFFLYGLIQEQFNPQSLNSGFITERIPQGQAKRLYSDTDYIWAGLDNDPNNRYAGQIRSFLSYLLPCPSLSACGAAPVVAPIGPAPAPREVLKATLSLHYITAVGDPLRKLATPNSACTVGVGGTPQPANFVVKSAFYDSLDEGDYSRIGGQELLCHLDSVPANLDVDVTQAVRSDWNNLQSQQGQSQFVMFFANTNPAPEFNALQIAGPGLGVDKPLLSVDFLVDQ